MVHPVIREIAVAMDWKEDFSLLSLGLLRKDEKGKYVQTSADITTGPEVNSLAVKGMNREYTRLGIGGN